MPSAPLPIQPPQKDELILMSWSGGKDSCMALRELLRDGTSRLDGLLTTMTRDYDRISMHGVRRQLLLRQAQSLGLTLYQAEIPKAASNEIYEAAMAESLLAGKARGVDSVAFGDLFLEDIRAYRERFLAKLGLKGLYPIWGNNTTQLIHAFIAQGFKTVVVCVDPAKLDGRFVGRVIDHEFLSELPDSVDPCGENGEFHTFVFDGPLFKRPVKFAIGEALLRDKFWFCDLIPEE